MCQDGHQASLTMCSSGGLLDTEGAPWVTDLQRPPPLLVPLRHPWVDCVSDPSRIGNESSGRNAHNFLRVSDGCFLKWSGHTLTWFMEMNQFQDSSNQ